MCMFFILYPPGLVYKIVHKIMHIIIIYNPNAMIFGRLVPG